jgi:hypothetical protein
MMTRVRGASNTRAKADLGWAPVWRSWGEGFGSGLEDVRMPTAA